MRATARNQTRCSLWQCGWRRHRRQPLTRYSVSGKGAQSPIVRRETALHTALVDTGVPRGREGRAAKCATTTTRRRRSVLMVPVPRAVAAGAVLHARPQPCAVCPRRASVMMDGWTPAECSLHTCTSNLGPLGARAPHQGSTRRRRAPGGCGCLLVCDKFPASGRRTAPGARQARAPPSNPGPPQLAPRSEPASLR